MKDYHINIFYSDEDEGYIADIPDLEACSAFGGTPEEALNQVQIAKALWLEAARAEGKVIPEPKYRPIIYQLASYNEQESQSVQGGSTRFSELANELAAVGRLFYARGWALGTSGNFSAVTSREPLRLAITASGVDKGLLAAEHILEIDGAAQAVAGAGR